MFFSHGGIKIPMEVFMGDLPVHEKVTRKV